MEKPIDYKECLTAKTPDQRDAWCSNSTGGTDAEKEACNAKFCTFCCDSHFPVNLKAKSHECKKECEEDTAPNPDVDFGNCIEPNDAKHSYGLFCDHTYKE